MGAIGEIKLMFFFQIMDHLTEILMPFGFEKPDVTDNTDEILDLSKKFSSKLRQLDASCLESSMFSESDALTLAIASSSVTFAACSAKCGGSFRRVLPQVTCGPSKIPRSTS